MPVNVGSIAQQAIASRFNPYKGTSPGEIRAQYLSGAWQTIGQGIAQAGSTIGGAIRNLEIDRMKVDIAKEQLTNLQNENQNNKAKVERALSKYRDANNINVEVENDAAVKKTEELINNAVSTSLDVQKAGTKSSTNPFKSEAEAKSYIGNYEHFEINGAQQLNKIHKAVVVDGAYDPTLNPNEEVLGFAIDQGRQVYLDFVDGQTILKTEARLPKRDEFDNLILDDNGDPILNEELTPVEYVYDKAKLQNGTLFNTIQAPDTPGTLIPKYKETLKKSATFYNSTNQAFVKGDKNYNILVEEVDVALRTNPGLLKSWTKSISRNAGEKVEFDTNQDGKITAEEVVTTALPYLNLGREKALTVAEQKFAEGQAEGFKQKGKESILGPSGDKLTAEQKNYFAKQQRNQGVLNNFIATGDEKSLILSEDIPYIKVDENGVKYFVPKNKEDKEGNRIPLSGTDGVIDPILVRSALGLGVAGGYSSDLVNFVNQGDNNKDKVKTEVKGDDVVTDDNVTKVIDDTDPVITSYKDSLPKAKKRGRTNVVPKERREGLQRIERYKEYGGLQGIQSRIEELETFLRDNPLSPGKGAAATKKNRPIKKAQEELDTLKRDLTIFQGQIVA
ncbi:MAG: hypothetical protein MPJ25_00875 [Pirellulales bacterium]|nr:hypothetical protein [Pirellulales bacterium]